MGKPEDRFSRNAAHCNEYNVFDVYQGINYIGVNSIAHMKVSSFTLHVTKCSSYFSENQNEIHLSRVMRKPTFWFPTWSDTNQAVQPQKIVRGLKFQI